MKILVKPRYKWKPEKLGGKKITLPGLYVKPLEALRQYSDMSQEQKMAEAYKDEGMPIPNFEMMDKIERLEALSEYRAIAIEKKALLDQRNSEAEKAAIKADIEKQKQQAINEYKQQQTANSNTGGSAK